MAVKYTFGDIEIHEPTESYNAWLLESAGLSYGAIEETEILAQACRILNERLQNFLGKELLVRAIRNREYLQEAFDSLLGNADWFIQMLVQFSGKSQPGENPAWVKNAVLNMRLAENRAMFREMKEGNADDANPNPAP